MGQRSSVSSLRRVRSDLPEPPSPINSKTLLLSNLHRSTDVLRHTSLLLRLSRDPEHGPPSIDAVEGEESKWIRGAIRSEAMEVLERGMQGLNQGEVGAGLQVLYDLGELKATVARLVNKYEGMGVKSINAALDTKAMSTTGGGWNPRNALWKRIEECVERLHLVVVAVWHLQRVLSQTRDPVTHVSLLDDVVQDGDAMLSDRVWEALVQAFASQMQSAFAGSISVNSIFTAEYPKMLSTIENLLEWISRDTDVEGVLPAITPEVKHQMVSAIDIFETRYLCQCSKRLIFLVKYVIDESAQGSGPSKLFFLRIVSYIQEEIEKAVQLDRRLTLLVLHEIGMALRQLAPQAENQMSTGPEARQVMGPVTAAQLKNFTICQHLQEFHTRISSLIREFRPVAADELSPALGAIYEVACNPMTSLFQSMLDRLESCIMQIHDQNFGVLGMGVAMDNSVSPYMEELQKCILHFRTEFLVRMLTPAKTTSGKTETICTRLVRNMASRVLIFFIRHAALVRPFSESGRLRLTRDMAELELSVSQNLFKVEQLGAPYRALRAFRPLILLETSQLGASPLLQHLPVSIILHHLYTRGPDDLQSPMQRNKLTPLQYSLWMDSQGEDQIWKGVKATLDDYAAKVRVRGGDKEFSPVYPLMLRVGSSLTKNASVAR
ncbi:conserved oligomeric Golgi complex subunit 5-like [Syzygium oleosum]|uniref:conserved oligomeric Golgi complex subunit 5-like n=1 Tax=Syzygium oleosum TaxID=219896 RepID=UPI0011D240DF|nr:conserved oligomeric Golgi complex subunit 5-like [Syzygium oleosum]